MATVVQQEDDIRELTGEDARAKFESVVQRRLKMSAAEFLKRLDSGEFNGREEEPRIVRILSLLPLVR